MIVVDTSVWSLALRRPPGRLKPPSVAALERAIQDDLPLLVPGIVLQELLSGLRDGAQRKRLEVTLAGFPILLAEREDHLAAAEAFTCCALRGVAASAIDCLIAAQCIRAKAVLLTTDRDFERMAPLVGLTLMDPEGV